MADGAVSCADPPGMSLSVTVREVLIVTLDVRGGMPGRALSAESGQGLRAEPGDSLVIDGANMAGPRIGTIISVGSADGSPPYLVHWHAGDYESRICPGPGARVQKRHPWEAQP